MSKFRRGTGLLKREAMSAGDVASILVSKIAVMQFAMVKTLDDAGKKVSQIDADISKLERELRDLLRKNPSVAAAIVDALRKNGVNTGSMESRLTDEISRLSGQSIYPPKWPVEKAEYAIIPE